jgi:hypothetical protein
MSLAAASCQWQHLRAEAAMAWMTSCRTGTIAQADRSLFAQIPTYLDKTAPNTFSHSLSIAYIVLGQSRTYTDRLFLAK